MIDVLPFLGREVLHFDEIKGLGHTELDTIRITVAKVAFPHSPSSRIEKDIAEGTGLHAHSASYALALIHHNGICLRATPDRCGGANLEAIGCFTLQTDHGGDEPLMGINVHADVRLLTAEVPSLDEGTGILTVPTPHTSIQIGRDHLHR